MLGVFFVGWPNPPSAETHLRILKSCSHVVVAVDDSSGRVVGFINAVSDGILSAYIPLLEVLPDYQGEGIGTELVRRMRVKLKALYQIDAICDKEVTGSYIRCGFTPATGVMLRNYENQSGANVEPSTVTDSLK